MLKNQINYQVMWARLYLLSGILFGLLFIIGAYILNDLTVLYNLLAAVLIFSIGWGMMKYPYAIYTENEIRVNGFFGIERKYYQFETKEEVTVENHRLYINGNKLAISRWLVDKADYLRMEGFYDDEAALIEELTDNE